MARNKTRADHVSDAAWAHTNLCLFATVVNIMESGNIKAESHAAAQRIIDIAQREQSKLLSRYDRAAAAEHSAGVRAPFLIHSI